MDQGRNSWLAGAIDALAPKEQASLGQAEEGEGVVDHLIRIARTSRRAPARRAAIGALFPAARDRLPGVGPLAVDLLGDGSRAVRYEACRALAAGLDPATSPHLQNALDAGVEVPWDGLERALRAIRAGNRDAFFDGSTQWVLQDETWDHAEGGARILGSAAYGTAVR